MVKITIEMVRNKAEHHDKELAPLREISMHQEGIEKIEYIQNWCPKLLILLLQSNLIDKIENLNKLKELEYLNLAINNIERVENLEKCESLQKLDLTLNFIGELTSINSLRDNYNLKILYLVGNPCTDYDGYRDYVIATLPQLEILDSEEIIRSERIMAIQRLKLLTNKVIEQQNLYAIKRMNQRIRMKKQIDDKWINDGDEFDEEENKRFWNEKSEHCPEMRIEIEKRREMKNKPKESKVAAKSKRNRPLFAPDGRAFNLNEAKLDFLFKDDNPNQYELDLHLYKHLDTSYVDVDIQPMYLRVTIKNKIFQISMPEEINIEKSSAKRSSTTGHLKIVLPKMKEVLSIYDNVKVTRPEKPSTSIPSGDNRNKREFLEIGPSIDVLDFTKMTTKYKDTLKLATSSYFAKEKQPSVNFMDDPRVPPLI